MFRLSEDDSRRPDLRARFSNSVYPFISEVVDNFKVGLKTLQDKLSAADVARLSIHLEASGVERYLRLGQLFTPGTAKDNEVDRHYTLEAIRKFVDVRSMLIQRFIAAYPLLLHVTKTMQEAHDHFKGKMRKFTPQPKATAAASTSSSSGATTAPPSGAKKRL